VRRPEVSAELPARSARRECLDRMLITVSNTCGSSSASTPITTTRNGRTGHSNSTRLPGVRGHPLWMQISRVLRRDRLGGLIHEYSQVA
jgi:hypothetical protein